MFKRYHDPQNPAFSSDALVKLVMERHKISYAGQPVDEWAAWPNEVVVDGPSTVGFLMRRVPDEFFVQISGRRHPAELSFLAAQSSPLWGDLRLPTLPERLAILHNLAGAVQALHQRGVVLGDISFANILWSARGAGRMMLIDCDGMCKQGARPVLPQAETIDWNDPLASPGAGTDMDRDRYKLALAVIRVLTKSLDARPGADRVEPAPTGVSDRLASSVNQLLGRAAGPVGSRPSAHEWAALLSGRDSRPVGSTSTRSKGAAPDPKPGLLRSSQPRQYRPVEPPVV
ncbi:hypothetical protein K1X13_14105 [Nocardioides sp. WL0053]|uniref:Protein kinase domain-containing protein n=1 Tax=Nocardioides jiangsuensis TaxID=2866161 RepID=A0ABS7RLN4_9ACTN|nr:hypothetical protein [Nocardioides jiangsuensis]MBY9075963.1 hypothetical protein [Nocardioides jiangsuensis]